MLVTVNGRQCVLDLRVYPFTSISQSMGAFKAHGFNIPELKTIFIISQYANVSSHNALHLWRSQRHLGRNTSTVIKAWKYFKIQLNSMRNHEIQEADNSFRLSSWVNWSNMAISTRAFGLVDKVGYSWESINQPITFNYCLQKHKSDLTVIRRQTLRYNL